jgi:glycosyltransferase involved in cell wall biosynthesis
MVAAFTRPDVVHIHAVGPSLLVPLARFFGLKVVVTHHGPDYDREKWNSFAKRVLRFGEWCGMVFANQRIVISPVIADLVQSQYGKNSTIIPNGVRIPRLDKAADELIDYDVRPGNYVLMVSRFVPEKRHFDLIEAFERAAVPGSKLVLVGDSDHPDEYQRSLIERAAQNSDIVLTGFLKGDILEALYQYAGVFVLPSSHEGLPICLLEALSYGLQCLASDIPANLSVGLDESAYFELGNTDELAGKIASSLQNPQSEAARDKIRDWVSERYDWNRIAQKTAEVYRITGT